MFDAEIAATLLNRWIGQSSTTELGAYLDLLREGNLDFVHQSGRVEDAADGGTFNIESLVFVDGSRTLRIKAPDLAPHWTRWTAVEPPPAFNPEAVVSRLPFTSC
ncbi:hypothetical protein FAZ69_06990 [Trinickia terrae]|uniref:Uncharacterized protein n=1 Tax=Trinickia terrae TaxID=2571161 RepID=A0A4U1IC69_9BURK|nr:hypothetical protein [Trinickia terrae]TKC91107.1 hypothetical protein FAZ69_06990 [Trinickia terrae]